MKTTYRIAIAELRSLFCSPVAWLILVIFAVQVGVAFGNAFDRQVLGQALGHGLWDVTASIFTGWMGIFPGFLRNLYLYIPLLTMGLMSREYSSGSIKLLFSSPVTNSQIILGKYISVLIYNLVLILPLFLIGIFCSIFIKNPDLGLLFTGMLTMVDITSGFSELPILSDILSKLSNPILGVLAGAIITLIVQSSAATVGILQALSITGIITYSTTIPIILGQNIGTCGTSILSSIGGSKNAKRTAMVHLYFNLIGTIIFLIFIYSFQFLIGFSFWEEAVDMGKIANFHTLFNIISTIILFPFIGLIEKLTMITIRDNQRTSEEDEANYLSVLNMLDERVSKIPNLAITNSTSVIESMGVLSEENFRKSMLLLKDFQTKKLEKIQQREDAIDKLDEEVVEFLVKLGSLDVSKQESVTITALMKIETEFEKIGDYAYKFSKKVEDMHEKNIKFSEIAYNDFERIYNVTEDAISTTIKVFKRKNINDVIEIEALKEFAEMQIENNRNSHIQRLKDGKCNVESGIAFLELLTICEKVIDHCLNISIATTNYMTNENFVTKQEFRKKVYKTKTEILKNKLNQCNHKYAK